MKPDPSITATVTAITPGRPPVASDDDAGREAETQPGYHVHRWPAVPALPLPLDDQLP